MQESGCFICLNFDNFYSGFWSGWARFVVELYVSYLSVVFETSHQPINSLPFVLQVVNFLREKKKKKKRVLGGEWY